MEEVTGTTIIETDTGNGSSCPIPSPDTTNGDSSSSDQPDDHPEGSQNDSTGVTPRGIDDLPDSLLLEVFLFLYHHSLCLGARLVCRRWRQVSHDPELWRSVAIPTHFTDDRFLLFTKTFHQEVEELDCSTCENITQDGFQKVAQLPFPRLRHLEMPITNKYTNDLYTTLAGSCPAIEQLENITGNEDDTCSPLKCQALFPKLKVVYDKPMSNYGRVRQGVTTEGRIKHSKWLADLKHLSDSCPDVETYRCRRGLNYMVDETAGDVARLFTKLKAVDFYYCSIGDKGISDFFSHQEGTIDTVALDFPGSITDAAVKTVMTKCPKINSLKISRCGNITNESLKHIALYGEELQEVHLHNFRISGCGGEEDKNRAHFSDVALCEISLGCPKLNNCRVFYSNDITSAGVRSLQEGCEFMHGLMFYDCFNIDDTSMNSLTQFRFLKALVLVNAEGVTPDGIMDLLLYAPCLFRLTLFNKKENFHGDMSQVAAETYEKLENNPNIRPNVVKKMTFKGVNGSFVQLATVLCPKLHSLDMREWNLVGSQCLRSVLQNCEQLATLDVPSLVGLDDDFLRAVVQHGHALKKLNLGTTVRRMSTKALLEVFSKCPSLAGVTMDTHGSDLNEDLLVAAAKIHHGNRCFFHVDPDCRETDETVKLNHRFVGLYFTPIKFLGSIRAIPI